MTPLQIVGTMDRMDWCDIYYGKLVSKRMSLVPEAYYWTGINYQFFVLFKQLASTSLCYINLCLYLFCNYKIAHKSFESFVQISMEKNMRSDQMKYCHVPKECLSFQ